MTTNRLRTGITHKRGRYVWFAALTYNGKTFSRTGETKKESIAKLEAAVNKVSHRPVYLLNF